ncbi:MULTISPECIES: DUF1609 domain-containing protein [unclassified Candidatus Cardinium]|uniref:DUF1609 domain-containing protein n=1 Tax=unclassified Candidatus Cardinium TaxID=2641185 RepID=UPI001FB39565|nr:MULTISPECIES: DUF1609 domain-containing protein [unclassified Candidatus Cardinium]
MITIQLPTTGIRYCLVYWGVTLIISCKSAFSSHPMTLYSQCHLQNKEKAKKEIEKKEVCYKLHPRVTRWNTPKIYEMKIFLDKGISKYRGLADEELWLQRAFHYLPGVVNQLYGKYHNYYFTINGQEQDKIKSAEATVSLVLVFKEKNKPKEVYHGGKIEIGMCNTHPSIIHHMMFRPKENRPSLKVPYIHLPEQNKWYEVHQKEGIKIKKNDKIGFQRDKIDGSIVGDVPKIKPYSERFCKDENLYIIKYAPLKKSPHKLVTICMHKNK